MQPDHIPAPLAEVIEPEVLPSLDSVDSQRSCGQQGSGQPLGCSVGPGCGCIGLPIALLAGAVVSAFMALLWLLSLGRVPVSVVRMVQRLRQRPPRG